MSMDSITALDSACAHWSASGWLVQDRGPTTLQLIKPTRFNPTEGVLLAIVCCGLVLLAGIGGILLALLLVLGDLVWYSARRDERMVLVLGPDGAVRRIGTPAAAALTPAQQANYAASTDPTRRGVCLCGHAAAQHGGLRGCCTHSGLVGECPCATYRAA